MDALNAIPMPARKSVDTKGYVIAFGAGAILMAFSGYSIDKAADPASASTVVQTPAAVVQQAPVTEAPKAP